MEHERQEKLAALLWQFIEQIRGQEQLGAVVNLDAAEVRELLALLTLAASVRDALAEVESTAPDHFRARQRVEQALRAGPSRRAARQAVSTGARPAVRQIPAGGRPPVFRRRGWGWATVLALVALVTGLIGLRLGQQLPGPDPLTHPPAHVLALSHARVRQWMPRLLKNQLAPAEARAMWWHLAHCDDCFQAYQQQMSSRALPRPTASLRVTWPRVAALPLPDGTGGTIEPSWLTEPRETDEAMMD